MGRRDCLRVIEQQALQKAEAGTGDRKAALTAFPFSSQVTVGTGAPAAVHRSVTMEPKVMFWDSGAFRILAKTVGEDKGLNGCLQLRLVWHRGASSQHISKQATASQRKVSRVLLNNSLMRRTRRRNEVGSVVIFHTLQTKILALEIYTQPLFTGGNMQKPPRWLAVNRRHITIWKHGGDHHGGRGWSSDKLISVIAAIRTHHREPQTPLFSMPWWAWVVSFYHLTMGARPAKALGNWDCTGQEGFEVTFHLHCFFHGDRVTGQSEAKAFPSPKGLFYVFGEKEILQNFCWKGVLIQKHRSDKPPQAVFQLQHLDGTEESREENHFPCGTSEFWPKNFSGDAWMSVQKRNG